MLHDDLSVQEIRDHEVYNAYEKLHLISQRKFQELNQRIKSSSLGGSMNWGDVISVISEALQFIDDEYDLYQLAMKEDCRNLHWGWLDFSDLSFDGNCYIQLARHKSIDSKLRGFSYEERFYIPFSLDFSRCTFKVDFQVLGLDFEGIYFKNTVFDGGVHWEDCFFGSGYDGFQGMSFSGDRLVIERCEFEADLRGWDSSEDLCFIKCQFQRGDFSEGLYRKRLSFAGCKFVEVPSFNNTQLTEFTSFDDSIFPVISKETYVNEAYENMTKYRMLRSKMQGLGDDRSALKFFRLEMLNRKIVSSHENERFELLLSKLYSIVNDYGWDMFRPLRVLGMLYLLSVIVFYVTDGCVASSGVVYERWGEPFSGMNGLTLSAVYSLKLVFTPVNLFLQTNYVQASSLLHKFIELIFMFLSSGLWFVFLMSIRTRYKLK